MISKHIWATIIIVVIWIGAGIAIFQGNVDAFIAVLLTLLLTFYLIIFGLQKPKD